MMSCCQTCSSDRISLISRAALRIPSVLLFFVLLSAHRFLLFCAILGRMLHDLSELLIWTIHCKCRVAKIASIVSPSSDHAERRQVPKLSLVVAAFPGCRNEVSDSAWLGSSWVFADTFCSAVLMLLNLSVLPLAVSFISVRNCCITSAISCLNCCWNVTISATVTMFVHDYAAAGAAAADFRRLSSISTRDVA